MRIAFITNNRFPPREGIARHILEIARRLRARGHDPFILARGASLGGWRHERLEGIEVHHFPLVPIRPFHQHATHLVLQHWLDRGAMGAELLHVHLPLLPPLRTGLPIVATFHSPLLTDTAAIGEPGLRARAIRLNARLLSRRFEQWYLDQARSVVAVSRGVAAELASHYDLGERRPLVIRNGVDTAFFAPPASPRREPLLLYVGRLGYRKGLERLLEAYARLEPGLAERLVLLGEGPLERPLRRQARRLGIAGRVVFAGFGRRATVRDWLWRAACVVNPADYESGPLTLLEAMAAGAPLVSTPTGLVAELGPQPPLLVTPPSVDALAQGLTEALGDPAAAAARARSARTLARRCFAWDTAVDALEQLYGRAWRQAA